MPDIDSQLPEAAYAIRDQLPHHSDVVIHGTENKSVNMDALRNALTDVAAADLSTSDRQAAIDHLKAHARALNMTDEMVTELIGEIAEAPDYAAQIAEANTFVEAEELMLQMVEAGLEDVIIEQAHAKVIELAKIDREMFIEDFEGIIEKTEQDEAGLWHFTARVAQVDKVNRNKRLYPKEEFENNLPRVNRLCKAGRFNGRDGHAGWLGDDKPSEICVRYDVCMLQDNDLIMEGVLIPTQAGQNLAALWANGVQFEWSIIGYGKPESKTDDKGNWEYDIIHDYILDGCDPVRRGAANTRTLKMKKPKDGVEGDETAEAVEVMESAVSPVVTESSVEEPIMGEEIKTDVVIEEPKVVEQPKAPEIDVDTIRAQIKAELLVDAKSIAADAFTEAKAQAKLDAAKDAAISKLAEDDELVVKVVSKFIEGCASIEEIATAVETATPIAAQMKKPKTVETSGVFIHQNRERERFMFDGTMKAIDRPISVQGVKDALLVGLEDNGQQDPSNKRWIMEQILTNYEATKENYRYLYSMTKQGFQEAATTTTALGTTIPMVLPIIRAMLPQLIPFDIASVIPIDRPEARVYFWDPQYKTGTNSAANDGQNIDDSPYLDTAWTDHTEADTKSQIGFTYTHQTVTAAEKAVYWDYTSAVMQDMQAYYNMDVEASMMSAAVDLLAMEINSKFLETLAVGAGLSGTFNTGMPASGFQNLNDWLTWGLSQALNRASADISTKMTQPAGWIVTGPTQATLFEASHAYEKFPAGAVTEFGTGVRKTGVWQGLYTIYVFDWAEKLTSLKNKMLIGYRPRSYDRTAAVFCPYVPLYISPVDATASTNTIAHSVSSRNAMKVLQANGLYALTIGSAAGTALTYVN